MDACRSPRVGSEELRNNFLTGSEPNERIVHQNKHEVIRSLITEKTAIGLQHFPKDKLELLGLKSQKLPAKMAETIDNAAGSYRTKLMTNFKALNGGGVGSSVEFEVSPDEVVLGVKETLLKHDSVLEELIRKKFLQEKIEIYFRQIRELRELQVIGNILELKSTILRDAIHFRFLRLGQVDAQMEDLKKLGVLQAYLDKPLPDSALEPLSIKRTTSKSRARRTIEDVAAPQTDQTQHRSQHSGTREAPRLRGGV